MDHGLLARVTRAEPFSRAPALPMQLRESVLANTAFRRVLRTSDVPAPASARLQQVAMSLEPNEAIGWEQHAGVSQIFVVLAGAGRLSLGRAGDALDSREVDARSEPLAAGSVWVVEPHTWHNVRASASAGMKLLTLYTYSDPWSHAYGTVEQTRPVDRM